MKNHLTLLARCFAFVSVISCVEGQGTFQNLDFESVNISPPDQRGFLPFAEVFPGWIGYIGTNQSPQALYNGISLGAAINSIISPSSGYANSIIGRSYTAVLSAGQDQIINSSQEIVSAAIAQTSLIPVSAQSLRFSINVPNSGLLVTISGEELTLFALSNGANYTVYGCDISAFAGLTRELRFTERPLNGPFASVILDNVSFSTQPIPEPTALSLLGLGTLLLGWRFLYKRL